MAQEMAMASVKQQAIRPCRDLQENLPNFPFTLRVMGRHLRVFSRAMIGTDLFCKRITLTQSEI